MDKIEALPEKLRTHPSSAQCQQSKAAIVSYLNGQVSPEEVIATLMKYLSSQHLGFRSSCRPPAEAAEPTWPAQMLRGPRQTPRKRSI